ncbi:hypothetical protein F1880_003747 [Penicillium rolfsii]|nr:hypothetical protein F1880_003747 [Penicillium rolfsii]
MWWTGSTIVSSLSTQILGALSTFELDWVEAQPPLCQEGIVVKGGIADSYCLAETAFAGRNDCPNRLYDR